VNACADGNPERNENASEADQANGNATPSGQLAKQPLRRCGQREAGRLYVSGGSHAKTLLVGEEAYKGDQGDSEFTNLFDKALYCAIGPCRDNPVVSPPDAEGTTNRLQDVENEKRELS
jgi:hypothetical protein